MKKDSLKFFQGMDEPSKKKLKTHMTHMRAYVAAAKNVHCMDCGFKFPPCAMDFDHRPGETKVFELSRGYHFSLTKIRAEMAKCDIVCSNCHRVRTRNRTCEGRRRGTIKWRAPWE